MKIGEMSAKTGLSTHALRFYEKQGFIKAAKDANGHRNYTNEDVDLINWIACLKNSGMSLNRIKEFVSASQANDEPVLFAILTDHLEKLAVQQKRIAHYKAVTEKKLNQLKKP